VPRPGLPVVSDLPDPLPQHPPVVVNPSATLHQFGQVDHLGLIDIYQMGHLPIEGSELALQAHPLLFRPDIRRGVTTSVRILRPQPCWVRQQRFHVRPDTPLNQRRPDSLSGLPTLRMRAVYPSF
jgi:hypothetical protein